MKRSTLYKVLIMFVLLSVGLLVIGTQVASAGCDKPINGGPNGTEADPVTCTGTTGATNLQGGNDVAVNEGTITGNLRGGNGNDDITNDGTINNNLDGDGGNDELVNNGTVNNDILGDSGADEITNNNSVGNNINGGGGGDNIVNNGTVDGNINGGGGDDVLINNGTVGNELRGQNGNDTIYNYGSVGGPGNDDLEGGNGDDEIFNYGSVDRDILAGSGDDKVTIGDGALIGRRINGGGHTVGDELIFDFTTTSQQEADDFTTLLATKNPGNDNIDWGATNYVWRNFETLTSAIQVIVAQLEVAAVEDGGGTGPNPDMMQVTLEFDAQPLTGDGLVGPLYTFLVAIPGAKWLDVPVIPELAGYDVNQMSILCLNDSAEWTANTIFGVTPTADGKLAFTANQVGVCGVFTTE